MSSIICLSNVVDIDSCARETVVPIISDHIKQRYRLGQHIDFTQLVYLLELAQEKLPSLLELKYYSITDAAEQLGGVDKIKNTFISFQKYLYEIKAA